MRPVLGDDAFGRSRAADNEAPSLFGLSAAPQMTYFFADESSAGPASQPSPTAAALHRSKESNTPNPSTSTGNGNACSGRRNPADPADSPSRGAPRGLSGLSHHHLHHHDLATSSTATPPSPTSSDGSSSSSSSRALVVVDPSARQRPRPPTSPSHPASPPLGPTMTSHLDPHAPALLLDGPSGPASSVALSSMSSRRGSFAGFLSELGGGSHAPSLYGSHAATDDGEQPFHHDEGGASVESSMVDSGSAPQLIMPSIKMPSRRPFTDAGKAMGRLKVLVAGDSGVGKTSLVKAIVQACEHIVHVDPITPGAGAKRRRRRGGTSQITEIYASTKPYPEWWSEVDDFKVLRRRKSLGDAVLDRNICFVDTPGYGNGSSSMDTVTPVKEYVEGHLRRMSSNSLSDGDMLNLIGGDGGVQVDVVFYMVSNRLRPVDVQYLRQLAPLTNIIILLAQSDLMSPEQISASKEQIHSQLKEASIRLFSFSAGPVSSASSDPLKQGLYAISSATGSDHETMDASLLMSPDYVQPLISTDLTTLVQHVFSQEGASWLRHSAARKYVQWRRSDTAVSKPMSLYNPLNMSGYGPEASFPSSSLRHHTGQVLTPPMGSASSYALARITDHTQREERLAQVRLANWATDLQKSIANERAQYAALVRGERAVWLTEKLNECIQDGTLVPVPSTKTTSRKSGQQAEYYRRFQRQEQHGKDRQHEDPLGLLEVAADLRYKGLVALEVLGSLGVLGGLVVWVSKHYLQVQAYEFWERVWGR
ncbi:Septin-domain-containing protein [Lasiosphaeria hispida]|uniref:Septin-domain-containing protein n=1 Tax=Lasiosphaeria hispida TaxID=260671 RepID=A0AAJ0HLV7_9PEZI|nr:Septin-domain-containing protein [Lasiosphaeria hispida]